MTFQPSLIKSFFVLLTICSMILVTIVPIVGADTTMLRTSGFSKGVTWKPYVPLKRTTFVEYDTESYLDDYAYLAAVPSTVFYDENSDEIFTNPLLFYEEEYPSDKLVERSLNARQGLDYFMEDWMATCNGKLDKMTLINVDKNRLDEDWDAIEYLEIDAEDPYVIANDIALHEWSYSDEVVIAVIQEDHEEIMNTTYGNLQGTVSPENGILSEHFEVPQTNQVYPQYNEFIVPEGYKFMTVRSWYPCFYIDAGVPGFEGIINMSIPAGDRDLQIYCKNNDDWMMTGITNAWNAQGGMDEDKTSLYIYKSGEWSVALTDVPTKSMEQATWGLGDYFATGLEVQKHRSIATIGFGRYGRITEILQNMRQVTYKIDIEMYPGVMIDIPESPPFGARYAQFELSWDDPSVDLGISLIGPSGEEVLSTREEGVRASCHFAGQEGYRQTYSGDEQGMILERLGELLPGEKYQVCVFATNEVTTAVDFAVEYSWEQNYTRKEGDCLASATEGAVLASVLNAPLLYVSAEKATQGTIETLNKLGVQNIYIVDLGGYLSKEVKDQVRASGDIQKHFSEYDAIYSYIREQTGRNDVIFSTIDPFSYWLVTPLGAAGEYPGSLYIGPAAYIAAQHGSPVILIDNHPELSSAIPWHNELWGRNPNGISKLPTVTEMYLTGVRIYDFLKKLDYDKEGEESIITIGGQFDISLTWDRIFVGKGKPGRFIGSPTDISVWLAKTVFYPQLIFQNPALKNTEGIELISGSESIRRFPYRGNLGFKIVKPSKEETFTYPVLDTLICYDHKFNTRASKYWGFTYHTADGETPGETPSFEEIDEGVMIAVNGKEGSYVPDLSGSEVQPFYIQKAGYDPVFSTNFQANMHNLNQGVILWMINTHGGPADGGLLMFWDVTGDNPRGYPVIPFAAYSNEVNPWRGYEWYMGSTEEPDTLTSEIHGILPALAGNPDPNGLRIFTTALDWALARHPIRDILGKISSLPLLRFLTPDWFEDTQDYYDGVIITVFLGRFGTSWYNGSQVDDALGNIHSTGVSSVACLPAGKYLHLTMMRHGSVFQIMDPWATSWYSDVWQNGVPRGIALGKTVGEIYAEGISKVGILYISEPPQWWWDLAENVCLYGDPDLRIWAPSTEYSTNNYWEPSEVQMLRYEPGFHVEGHMPFGVTGYPNQYQQNLLMEYIWVLAVILIALFAVVLFFVMKKKKK